MWHRHGDQSINLCHGKSAGISWGICCVSVFDTDTILLIRSQPGKTAGPGEAEDLQESFEDHPVQICVSHMQHAGMLINNPKISQANGMLWVHKLHVNTSYRHGASEYSHYSLKWKFVIIVNQAVINGWDLKLVWLWWFHIIVPNGGLKPPRMCVGALSTGFRTRSDGRRDSDVFCVTNKLMCEKTQSLRELRSMELWNEHERYLMTVSGHTYKNV